MFCVEEEFGSYANLKEKISEFERMEFVQQSKSVKAAR